jgi:hypothetical protein
VLIVAAGWKMGRGADQAAISVLIYKTPGCECCEGYADYLRQHDFRVTVKATEKLSAISRKAGVPPEFEGCHTAFIDNYVVDGHVPIEAVRKLLAERPKIKGLALPGMPPGAPGMSGTKEGPFTIHAIGTDGSARVYMTI